MSNNTISTTLFSTMKLFGYCDKNHKPTVTVSVRRVYDKKNRCFSNGRLRLSLRTPKGYTNKEIRFRTPVNDNLTFYDQLFDSLVWWCWRTLYGWDCDGYKEWKAGFDHWFTSLDIYNLMHPHQN